MQDTSFTRYFTKPSYLQAYGFNEKIGRIYIEDSKDRAFWSEFAKDFLNNQYDISCASAKNNSDKLCSGKRSLEFLYSGLNPYALVAIDADNDTLAPNNSEYSHFISEKKYILNTFGYSKESLLCSKNLLKIHLDKMILYHDICFDIITFINKISALIYQFLPYLLFSIEHKLSAIKEDDFYKKIIITNKEAENIVDGNDDKFTSIKDSLTVLTNELNYDKEEFKSFKEEIFNKGFDAGNAYQFMNGHQLHDVIILPIIKAIIKKQQNIEKDSLEKNFTAKEIPTRRDYILNHFRNFSVWTLINCYSRDINEGIFSKIVERANSINSELGSTTKTHSQITSKTI